MIKNYKNSELDIREDIIFESSINSEVMGRWETPLMERYSEVLNSNKKDIRVLEIGYGLGIFFKKTLSYDIKNYTIVELRDEIIEMIPTGDNIDIIRGDWYENIDKILEKTYDVIFFDTHLDYNRHKFRELVVDKCLDKNGSFGYFTMGDMDVFNYNEDINMEELTLKTSDDSDYMGNTINMYMSYIHYPLKNKKK
jgi:hypothetical protein